jgi:signal transduction histidine kinase
MDRNRRPSIARQITLINTLVSGAALVVAAIGFGLYDRTTARESLVQSLSIESQIVASKSVTALMFNDPSAAEDTLQALTNAPNIVSAEIADREGRPFAAFDSSPGRHIPLRLVLPDGLPETHLFASQRVVLTRRIVFQDKEVGAVSVASDYSGLNSRRNRYIAAILVVLMTSIVAALAMSWLSQRAISKPIVSLAATVNQVTSERDYAVRASSAGNVREVVVLTDAFNDMLTQIEARDQSLRQAQDDLEQRVLQRTAELDAANRELEAFSYSVSHDLRAPLRHVLGFAELLEGHAAEKLDDRSRRYLGTITMAAQKMGQLIDDLLAFSRIGREQIVKRRVSLSDLVRDARQEVTAQQAADRDVEWHVGELPEVDADPAMLRLVMLNLLSNALKYSAPRARARIDIGTCPETNGEVVIFVRDNGVGFDMQYSQKLFGVFQRLHRSDEFDGTGIGLANVKRIILRHGGRVWAEGEIGRGATFYFSLPTTGTR